MDDDGGRPMPVALDDIPGGEEAFELSAKFCYGISINVCANNFVPVISAAKFLRMTEPVAKGNLVTKLESFFHSCILQGWRDSIVTLQSAWKLLGWSENRILQPCMDSVVQKILMQPSKVTWSYTYTRPGYSKKQHQPVPKDWWTEDISELNIELFRSIISTLRATRSFPPPLIGEALHVYAFKHLQDPSQTSRLDKSSTETSRKHRRILESIVTIIPTEPGSVTGRFLLRLLRVASHVGASPSTKAQLTSQAGRQLDEVQPSDLLIPSPLDSELYDLGATEAVLEKFLLQLEETQSMSGSMEKVAKIFDSFLEIIAHDAHPVPVSKFTDLAESLPDIARKDHDGLYRAIDTYLKEHPELSKADKKRLCRMIDCKKLSPDVRAEAISNYRMPLRTIVQLLFVEQEKTARAGSSSSSQAVPDRASVDISNLAVEKEKLRMSEQRLQVHHSRTNPVQRARTNNNVAMTRSLSGSNVARKGRVVEGTSGSTARSRLKNK